jgi:hypothetical protein
VKIRKIAKKLVGAVIAMAAAFPFEAFAADTVSNVETIIFIRHGEKPEHGLGQLNCQGLNRALALPKVLVAKFGSPAAIFAPNPVKLKNDDGKDYDYVRPLATIEPTAIQLGMPVDTTYGFEEIGPFKDALEQPLYRGSTIFVAWEHRLIDVLVKRLMKAHGGSEDAVPKWRDADYDTIYVVTITNSSAQTSAVSGVSSETAAPSIKLTIDHEGLDGQPVSCPD